jgi:hypothetical protein
LIRGSHLICILGEDVNLTPLASLWTATVHEKLFGMRISNCIRLMNLNGLKQGLKGSLLYDII